MDRPVKRNIAALAAAAAIALGLYALPAHAASDAHAATPQKTAEANSGNPADQARNQAADAQKAWNTANALLVQIDGQELTNQRTIAHLRRLGEALKWTNLAVAGLGNSDPKGALEQFDQQIAAIQGDGSGSAATWAPAEDAKLPTLSALKKQISQLTEEVSKQETEIKALTKKRDEQMEQADKLASKSDAEKGRQSVEDFKKASDLRKSADGVQREIDLAESKLSFKQQDLAVVKAQSQSMQKAVTQLEQERAALAAKWDALKKQMEVQRQAAQAIGANAEDKSNDSITAQLDQLDQGLKKLETLRNEAAKNFEQASSGFTAAANAAQNLHNSLRAQSTGGKEASEAQKTLQTVIDPQAYQLQKVAVMASLAQLKASEASSLRQRADVTEFLTPVLAGAGIATPVGLGTAPELKKKAQAAQSEADKAFKETDQMFAQLSGGSARNGATVLHILTLYNWSQLASQAGDEKNAAARLQAARALAENAAKNDVALPPLPPEISPASTPQTPAKKPA